MGVVLSLGVRVGRAAALLPARYAVTGVAREAPGQGCVHHRERKCEEISTVPITLSNDGAEEHPLTRRLATLGQDTEGADKAQPTAGPVAGRSLVGRTSLAGTPWPAQAAAP